MNNRDISRQTGLAQSVILLILAVLSYSLVGRFVDHSSRWVSHFMLMETRQTAKLQTTNYLNDLLLNLKINSVPSVLEKNTPKIKLNGTIREQTIKVGQKESTYFNVSVEAFNLFDANIFDQQEVILRKRKRLETPFTQAISIFTPANLNLFSKQFFSLESNAFKLLSKYTNQTTQQCSSLNGSATGLIWFNTKCKLFNKTLGSIERPIILVIENAELYIESTHIFGVVIHLCENGVVKENKVSMTSSLTGALISFCGTPQIQGSIKYSLTAIEALIQHDDNFEFAIVEGSWRSL